MRQQQLARALGWFSVGLGLAELLAPRRVGKGIGIQNRSAMLPLLGLREIISGIGILTRKKPTGWVRSRVAGDFIDLSLLAAALYSHRSRRGRLIGATAAVAGVTVIDMLCSRRLGQTGNNNGDHDGAIHVKNCVTINKSPEELYQFWRNFENLPRIMEHLQSVTVTGPTRSHWVAKGPAGKTVEWDAEIINEHANELIAWRSVEGSDVDHSGTVRFERAENDRGTIVTVQMQYCPPAGIVGAKLARLFGRAPEQQIANDLRSFKQLMETGEVATIKG